MKIRELGAQLRARKISCVELIEQTFAEIRKRERFNSFITLTEEQARAMAAERDEELASGMDRGPLHGIPTAHKDLLYTRGVRTTGGSLIYRDFIPDADAIVVTYLREAGAISIGKTNLHELAYGITSKNPHYGFVLNPRDTSRVPGGSSGGSAALVAGDFVPMCTGTDTAGSIRIPASFCGVVGMKPTYERVSREGVLPLSFSLDHVGPLASCVEDCALAMSGMAESGEFLSDPLSDLHGVRVGIPANYFFERIDPEVEAEVRRSIGLIERSGATVIELPVPDMAEVYKQARVVQMSETASLYAHYTDQSLFGKDVWALIQQAKQVAGYEYVTAQYVRTQFRREMDELWTKIDVLATPTTPTTAPRLDQDTVEINGEKEELRAATTRLTRPINYLGEPALSMPCGKSAEGLPIGLQLIAKPFDDAKLLQIARTVEMLLG